MCVAEERAADRWRRACRGASGPRRDGCARALSRRAGGSRAMFSCSRVRSASARPRLRAPSSAPFLPGQEVPSPSFTLVQSLRGQGLDIVHFDFYRLESEAELFELGWEDAVGRGRALVIVEWPELLHGVLPDDRLEITLTHGKGEGERQRAARSPWPMGEQARRRKRAHDDAGRAHRRIFSPPAAGRARAVAARGRRLGAPLRALDARRAQAPCSWTHRPNRARRPRVPRTDAYDALGLQRGRASRRSIAGLSSRSPGISPRAVCPRPPSMGRILRRAFCCSRISATTFSCACSRARRPGAKKNSIRGGRSSVGVPCQPPPERCLCPAARLMRCVAYDASVYQVEADLFIEWFLPAVLGRTLSEAERAGYHEAWRRRCRSPMLCRACLLCAIITRAISCGSRAARA